MFVWIPKTLTLFWFEGNCCSCFNCVCCVDCKGSVGGDCCCCCCCFDCCSKYFGLCTSCSCVYVDDIRWLFNCICIIGSVWLPLRLIGTDRTVDRIHWIALIIMHLLKFLNSIQFLCIEFKRKSNQYFCKFTNLNFLLLLNKSMNEYLISLSLILLLFLWMNSIVEFIISRDETSEHYQFIIFTKRMFWFERF